MVRKFCIKAILTKMTILKMKPIMHGYRTSHGVDLNENENFNAWKLVIHGSKNLDRAILTKMKIIRRDKKRYYLVDLLG